MQTTPSVPRLNASGKSLLKIPRVARFLELIVDEGKPWKEAARECKLRIGRARFILTDKAIRQRYYELCDVARMAERARNIHVAAEIRDGGAGPSATAAQRKAALDAMKYLDGEDASSITINGGQNVIAGYVVKLDGPARGPQVIASQRFETANPLIKHADDITDIET